MLKFCQKYSCLLWVHIILLFCPISIKGEGFAPVRNFTRHNYNAGSQNWGVTQDALGRLYFANRDGMLKYDGVRWTLHRLPNYTTVRSVFADDKSGRIYAGGSGEFGYFESDPVYPRLHYVSLLPLVPKTARDFTEIWNINEIVEGKVAFQGDFKVFIVEDGKVAIIASEEKLTSSSAIKGILYVGSQNGTLTRLEGDRLKTIGRVADGSRIVGILPGYDTDIACLIVTASGGIYTYRGSRLELLELDIRPFLQENQVFCANSSGNIYAFGTVNKGAVTYNIKTGEKSYINRSTGLQDNTVLGLGFDYSSNLWLCLDNGISYAMVDSPVFNLLGGMSEAGAGYASMLAGGKLYVATNRGLFSASYPFPEKETPPLLERIHAGQVWGIDSIGSTIFVSADNGLYTIKGNGYGLERVGGIEEGCWFVAPLRRRTGKALVSTYNGFYILERTSAGWKAAGKIDGYDDAGGHFVEDKEGNIWIAHWMKGIYRLRLSPDLKRFEQVKLYTSADGLPSERDNSLAIYNGMLRIATASGEFFKTTPAGKIVRDESLTRLIPLNKPAHFYALPSGISFAFSQELVWKMERDNQGKMIIDSISLRPVASSLIPGFEHVGFIDVNTMLVSHQDGFYSIDLNSKPAVKWKNGVFVESLVASDSVFFSGLPKGVYPEVRIPYRLNSLTFNFSAPEYRFENAILYSCKLEDYDKDWSAPSETASKEYTQLHEGKYTLRLRALNTVTGETAESSFAFQILPPWYRSLWAKICYAAIVILLILTAYRLLNLYSERKARKVKEQKEAEMEAIRKEAEKEAIKKDYEIASLKSEQLEQDIKHKSSELSNTTMNVIRKNEILLDISSMLKKMHEKTSQQGADASMIKRELDKIQGLIEENISHDDDWKKFNQNFDIVYEDFTRHLGELHPNLTLTEKRLCCYLRMGLSSKEIAPIFSISPKSVEMNRYRLRRKMGLEREVNLVEYLQGI